MKTKNIVIIVIGLVLGLAACKNEGDHSLIGKWQEVKVRTYYKSYSGVISNDTTYTSAFDTTDYALFSADGSCVLSNHHVFEPTTANLYGSTGNYVSKESYNYAPVGSGPKYVLTLQTTLIYPSGFTTTDTLSRSGNGILIQTVTDNHQDYTVSDAYYTR
ncbi:MAG: hypothetical protein ACHQHN_16990 [Sphingobacteriales bacterium]